MKRIKCSRYTISSTKIPTEFNGCRIVMLSDLHDNLYEISLGKLKEMIEKEKPDIILIAGDLITRYQSSNSEQVLTFIKELAEKYTIYFSNGNHETRVKLEVEKFHDRYERVMKALEDCGVKILNNCHALVKKENAAISVYGIELEMHYYRKFTKPEMSQDYLCSQLGMADHENFNILIAHSPEYFEAYTKWGADLILSGHIHGGIIRLPVLGGVVNTDFTPFPKYDGGLFQNENGKMIVGRGLGTHTINFRFNNPPELVSIGLTKIL